MIDEASRLFGSPGGGYAMVIVLAAAFAGAFVKGVTTLGLALFAVPMISLFLDVQTAILSLFLSKCLSDVAMVVNVRKEFSWRLSMRVVPFAIFGLAAIPVATLLLANSKGPWLYLFLAASILIFIAFQLRSRRPAWAHAQDSRWSWGFGFAAGASQGLTGAAGPYAAMYLYGLGLTTSEFVFLSSVIYLLFDCSQLAAILYTGLYDRTRFLYALLTIVPVMAGTYVGIHFRGKLNDEQFRKVLLGILALSAGGLIYRATRI
jgi:uncharacterized membrane protein YfcA